MKISELIKELERIKAKNGDIRVLVQSLSHVWEPEPEVRGPKDDEYVLLNP